MIIYLTEEEREEVKNLSKEEKVRKFLRLTDDRNIMRAKQFLVESDWDFEEAINLYNKSLKYWWYW